MYGLHEHYVTYHNSQRSFWKEFQSFVVIFGVVFVLILIGTNLQLFAANFRSLFVDDIHPNVPLDASFVSETNTISRIIDVEERNNQEIQGLLKHYEKHADATMITPSLEDVLQSRLMNYDFSFNTVPPVDRLLIPSLGLDVPIVTVNSKNTTDFMNADFDDELDKGIVKYPTTPDPGQEGNTLLFGHTSYVVWKDNPYGTIFKDLPKLKDNMLIQVLWKGNLYEYKVIDLFIVPPHKVPAQYMTYQNAGGSYITLMGCYPLGTDNKRIMAVAKLIK